MLKKYNDMPAAISLGIFLLGGVFYVVQTIFMTEAWLLTNQLPAESIVIARIMGMVYLGFVLGLVMTFMKGPDGQSLFFTSLLVAQIGTFLILWHSHIVLDTPGAFDDAIIVSILTAFLLYGYIRIQSRL